MSPTVFSSNLRHIFNKFCLKNYISENSIDYFPFDRYN